jgi:steroid 5-alpha reductase family enzyme
MDSLGVELAGAGILLATIAMLGAWALSLNIRNASIVDIVWSALFTPLAVLYALAGSGWPPRRLAVAAVVAFWSLRLARHLFFRIAALHPTEEPRYLVLRQRLNGRFFSFFQLQGLSTVVLSMPFLLACLDPAVGFRPVELVGYALCLVAVVGEGAADAQLERFRAERANRGAVCRIGLWQYSRHPNYFFEWLVWLGFFLVAVESPWGWATAYCPLMMLYLLFRVTGIPMLEDLAVTSKGNAYREYQRTTSVFVPRPPKA